MHVYNVKLWSAFSHLAGIVPTPDTVLDDRVKHWQLQWLHPSMFERGMVGLSSCMVCHPQLIQTWLCLEDLVCWNACHWQSFLSVLHWCVTCGMGLLRLSIISSTLSSLSVCFLLGGLAMASLLSEPTSSLWACLGLLRLLPTIPSHHKVILLPGYLSSDHAFKISFLLQTLTALDLFTKPTSKSPVTMSS